MVCGARAQHPGDHHEPGAMCRGHERGHTTRSRNPTRIPAQRGWRARISGDTPNASRPAATIHLSRSGPTTTPATTAAKTAAGDGKPVSERERRQCSPYGRSSPFLKAERHGEEPSHGRVYSVPRAQQNHGWPDARSAVGHAKQKESEDASPPWSRTWCGRNPSLSSRKKFRSKVRPPSLAASSFTIQPPE
jgi:hypothetical protein